MIRSDVLKELKPIISNQLVVCNIGLPSQELHNLDDQPSNFYMLGTMGLASSIGLGLALVQDAGEEPSPYYCFADSLETKTCDTFGETRVLSKV